jgi:hypothetical protein
MPSTADLDSFNRMRNDQQQPAMPAPPPLPQDIKDRFPSMVVWEQQFQYWAVTQLGAKIIGQT